MTSRQHMKPRSALDDRREEIRSTLAALRKISKTARALNIAPDTLRNYLRNNRDLLPDGTLLYQKSPLYDIPKERITALLREHSIEQTANLLGVRTSQLSSFLCRFPALRPPEMAARKYKGRPPREPRAKDVSLAPYTLFLSVKDIKFRSDKLLSAYRELNLLETFLRNEWDIQPGEYLILMLLNRINEPMESTLLYQTLSVSPSRLSRYLSAMENKGMVQRTIGSPDKRLMLFSITPEGTTLFKNIEKKLTAYGKGS